MLSQSHDEFGQKSPGNNRSVYGALLFLLSIVGALIYYKVMTSFAVLIKRQMFQIINRIVVFAAAVVLMAGIFTTGSSVRAHQNGGAAASPSGQITIITGANKDALGIRSTRFR